MKCKFVIDQDVNPASMPDSERAKVKFRSGKVKNLSGKQIAKVMAYFEAGTEYEHPKAWFFVINGQAVPADDECEVAAKEAGLTDEDLRTMQHRYKRQHLGITEEDIPLYDAGVILGYDKKSSDGYIHGPKWDEYQAALKAAEEAEKKEFE